MEELQQSIKDKEDKGEKTQGKEENRCEDDKQGEKSNLEKTVEIESNVKLEEEENKEE